MTTFKNSLLIQRLERYGYNEIPPNILDKPFGYGIYEGYRTDDGRNDIKSLFSYSYMGSSEFEFGAIPEAWNRLILLIEEKQICTGTLNLDEINEIYYICPEKIKENIIKEITMYYKQYYNDYTKECVGLKEYFFGNSYESTGPKAYHLKNIGWFSLDNTYMFFTNFDVFFNICWILGIKI